MSVFELLAYFIQIADGEFSAGASDLPLLEAKRENAGKLGGPAGIFSWLTKTQSFSGGLPDSNAFPLLKSSL